jgi:VWFA-related protein
MSIRKRFRFLLLPATFSAALLFAQQNPPPAPAATSTINLDVVVTPKSGPPVADLQQQDFTIFDDKMLQHITSFRAFSGSRAQVEVILVVDAVNVPYERIAYEREEIDKFLHATGGQLAHPTKLAFFTDDGMQLQQDFATDGNELSSSLDHYAVGLRNIRRSSQYQASDRFQLSINALRSLIGSIANRPGRKMILWVSPGWPLLSGPGVYLDAKQQNQIFASIVDFSTQLRQAQATLYSIDPIGAEEGVGRTFYYENFVKGVSKPGQVEVGDLSLQVLATQSGGLVLTGNNNLVALLQQCTADSEAYYELSFSPAPTEHRNEYHHLAVQVAKPGLTARTREGYYAQP